MSTVFLHFPFPLESLLGFIPTNTLKYKNNRSWTIFSMKNSLSIIRELRHMRCGGLVVKAFFCYLQGCRLELLPWHRGVGLILINHWLTPPRCNGYLAPIMMALVRVLKPLRLILHSMLNTAKGVEKDWLTFQLWYNCEVCRDSFE